MVFFSVKTDSDADRCIRDLKPMVVMTFVLVYLVVQVCVFNSKLFKRTCYMENMLQSPIDWPESRRHICVVCVCVFVRAFSIQNQLDVHSRHRKHVA